MKAMRPTVTIKDESGHTDFENSFVIFSYGFAVLRAHVIEAIKTEFPNHTDFSFSENDGYVKFKDGGKDYQFSYKMEIN